MAKRKTPPLKRAAFLAAYAKTGNITQAAKAAKCSRKQHYVWMEDPEYAEAFAAAHEEAIDVLEKEARRRAIEGVRKPVFQGGELVGTVREYSDTLLIFLLKGARPDKYRDNWKGEITGPNNGPLRVDLSALTDAELEELRRMAQKAAESGGDRGGSGATGADEDLTVFPA